jgi:hypothetical protein
MTNSGWLLFVGSLTPMTGSCRSPWARQLQRISLGLARLMRRIVGGCTIRCADRP